jgi:hypothetical protein
MRCSYACKAHYIRSHGCVRYLQAAGQPAGNVQKKTCVVSDPYSGEVALFWKASFICGVLRLRDAPLRDRYLEAMRKSIDEAP